MSRIEPHKLDELLFDYVEGNLDAESREALQAYIEAHPELKVELQAWEQTRVEAPAGDYPGMDDLLKPASGFGKAWLMRGIGLSSLLLLCTLGYFLFSGNHGAGPIIGSHSPEPFSHLVSYDNPGTQPVTEPLIETAETDVIAPRPIEFSDASPARRQFNDLPAATEMTSASPVALPVTDLPDPKHRYLMRMKLMYLDDTAPDDDLPSREGDRKEFEAVDYPDPMESRKTDSSMEPMRTHKEIRVGDKIRAEKERKKGDDSRPSVID